MRALVIGHDHVASVEHVAEALRERGYQIATHTVVPEHRFDCPEVDAVFPDVDGVDLVIILGAPWPRERIAEWAAREVAFLDRAARGGVAVLGICFGAQLLAEALGGGTRPLGETRIGWRRIRAGEGVPEGPWFHWHTDQLVPPDEAAVLAESDDGVAAFRLGRCAGVQFHPEMTPGLLERWLALPGGPPGGLDVTAVRRDAARHAEEAAAGTPALLDALL